MLCISARRHLQDPQWDSTAAPKHDFDQFEELQRLIFDGINRAGYVVDRRLENAQSLRDFVFNEVRREIGGYRSALMTAGQQVLEAEKRSFLAAVSAMKKDDARQLFGVGLMVYQKLAQRWVGPIGWMIAIWTRLLIFGTGIAALFRLDRPAGQIRGMISAWRNLKEAKTSVGNPHHDDLGGTGLRSYRLSTLRNWPDIAESLVGGGFSNAVRSAEDALVAVNEFSEKLTGSWVDALESELERISRRLSGWLLQMIFNLPVFAILGYTGWLTVQSFLLGSYLGADFFVHALGAIGIILLLSFFIFQVCVRLSANPERITTRAFENMKRRANQFVGFTSTPVLAQLEIVLELDAILASPEK